MTTSKSYGGIYINGNIYKKQRKRTNALNESNPCEINKIIKGIQSARKRNPVLLKATEEKIWRTFSRDLQE